MHSVHCNATRTTASLAQRTRFGIGDVYFLAAAYGLMEVVVDNIKRCSGSTVHLESGKKLEDVGAILKCIGMLPDSTVDKVVHAKFMRGHWINGDPRRFCCADPDGIYAANFSSTTIGPGDKSSAIKCSRESQVSTQMHCHGILCWSVCLRLLSSLLSISCRSLWLGEFDEARLGLPQ